MQYMPPEHFGAFYFLLLGVAALVLFVLPAPRILARVWRRPWAVLTVSLLNAVMVYTHFLALQLVEVAYMIAVKRTSLLFGILYGALFFRERGLGPHLVAGSLMVCGVFLILY
jgi:drug/metabolite transporter (DMT)-like permease